MVAQTKRFPAAIVCGAQFKSLVGSTKLEGLVNIHAEQLPKQFVNFKTEIDLHRHVTRADHLSRALSKGIICTVTSRDPVTVHAVSRRVQLTSHPAHASEPPPSPTEDMRVGRAPSPAASCGRGGACSLRGDVAAAAGRLGHLLSQAAR